jgi:hypothetical protein
MAIGDVVRARIHYRLFAQECQTGLHFRNLTGGATPAGLATLLATGLALSLEEGISADATIHQISVESVYPPTAESVEEPMSPLAVGDLPGESLPPQVAAVISLHTGLKGRRRRGRMYVSGLERGNANAGLLDGAQLAGLITFADYLIAQFGVGGANADYRAVVFSPEDLDFVNKAGDPAPRVGTLVTDVTTAIVDPVTRSQRRRQIGVGS